MLRINRGPVPASRPVGSLSLDFTGGAALDSKITFTRATSAWYFDSAGTLTDAGSGNPRFDYDPATAVWNYIRNNTMVGAAAGTSGTLPTNWTQVGTNIGTVTRTILGTGVESGITYIDIRWAGTTAAAGSWFLTTDANTQIDALTGQAWSSSGYVYMIGGSTANLNANPVRNTIVEADNAGAAVTSGTQALTLTGGSLAASRFTLTRTLSGGASVAKVQQRVVHLVWDGAVAIDITLRIGMPQLELAASAGAVVATSGAAAGAYATARGLLVEEQRSNLMLWSRDLTNAAWTTKTTVTPLKDQIGIDGAANSASSVLATGATSVISQTITQAATSSTVSFYLKRLIGTGTITIKQGATTLDVTASLNMSTWTRVTLAASVLNPEIGIVMATSGDKIAVDCGQFEVGAFATSVIPTSTAAATRNADSALISTIAPWYNQAEGTIVAQAILRDVSLNHVLAMFSDGTTGSRFQVGTATTNGNFFINAAAVTQMTVNAGTVAVGTPFKIALAAATEGQGAIDGTLSAHDPAVTMPTITQLRLGGISAVNSPINGWLQRLIYYPRRLPDGMLQSLST